MIRAAIAIGSNSTRSLVAKVDTSLTVLHRGREETRLLLGMDEQGLITEEAMARTVDAVHALQAEALRLGAETVDLMATSASRDAGNSDLFAARLLEKTGLSLRIISGQEEAALAFRAVAGRQSSLVMDIGGGSTELTYGEDGQILSACSLQLGASRLLKMQPIASTDDAKKALAMARASVRTALDGLNLPRETPAFIGLGGTCTTCAAVQMQREAHGDSVEGVTISRTEAEKLLLFLAPLMPAARAQVPGIPPSRVHHFPHGLCILLSVMEEAGLETMTVSGRTNLDGYLMSFMT